MKNGNLFLKLKFIFGRRLIDQKLMKKCKRLDKNFIIFLNYS